MLRSSKPKKKEEESKKEDILPKFLNFLETEFWNLPIAHFVEQNSIVFDREQGDPTVYATVHEKYKQLVDTLIDSYCQDIGVSGTTVVDALKSAIKAPTVSYKNKVLLEPIIAAEDFNVFVPMMMRKNIELQLQALKMIEHIHELPSSLKLDEEDEALWKGLFDEDESERLILISVLKQSKAEWEREQRVTEAEWQRQLDAATRDSLAERQALISQRDEEQRRLDSALQQNEDCFKGMTIGDNSPSTSDKSAVTTESGGKGRALGKVRGAVPQPRPSHYIEEDDSTTNAAENSNKFGYRNLLKEKECGISDELVRQRTNYLREQRDKLLAKKQKERERQLDEAAKTHTSDRPRTAKAARSAMQNELDSRRSIAAKIKARIMEIPHEPQITLDEKANAEKASDQ